jgi:hypothetical protein
MFVRYEDIEGDGFYERVATLSVQIPRDFNSTADLWSRIPLYYRTIDDDYVLNTADYNPKVNPDKGPLYRYIELFGWELDKMRTTIYDTMRINDPEVVHSSAINALANQTGVEFKKEALGTSKLRAVLNNIGYLRRSKGTQESVEAYIAALSGCGVTTTTHFNDTKWTTSSVFGSTAVNGVAYGNGRWVAVGASGKTSTSTNGTTWSATVTVGNTRELSSVAYGNGLFVAVGTSQSNSATPCIYKSTDGVTWTAVFNGPSTGYYLFRDVTYANGVWVAVGQLTATPLLCTSPDGTNWTVKSTGITGNYQLYGVAHSYNGKWIATSSYAQTIAISTDNGATWSSSAPSTLPSGPSSEIFYADNTWLIVVSGTYIYSSVDNGVTWVLATDTISGDIKGISKTGDTWVFVDTDGGVYTSTDTENWSQVFLQGDPLNDVAIGGVDTKRIVIVGNSGYLSTNYQIIDFDVHPMRVNLFTDPFFNQGLNAPVSPDTGEVQRVWTNLDAGGREYGWGVYSVITCESLPSGYAMSVSTDNDKLTVTFPALQGTATVLIYSRGKFAYNNNLIYYYSAASSHNFTSRFVSAVEMNLLEYTYPPTSATYFDNWNNSVSTFPSFKDFLTSDSRKIVSSIPKTTTVDSIDVVPVYKFDIELSSSSDTILTFEKPLVEYKNSDGSFFSGDEPTGGFIQDPTDSLGAGLYDYHWGASAGGSSGTDFSFYTMDEHRVQSVVDNVIENYIVPVTIVKNTDYQINWNVLE